MLFHCAILFAPVHRAQGNAGSGCTGSSIDSRLRNVFGRHGKGFIETATIPEIRFGASQSGVAGFDRPAGAIVPLGGGAGVVSGWTLAAEFV